MVSFSTPEDKRAPSLGTNSAMAGLCLHQSMGQVGKRQPPKMCAYQRKSEEVGIHIMRHPVQMFLIVAFWPFWWNVDHSSGCRLWSWALGPKASNAALLHSQGQLIPVYRIAKPTAWATQNGWSQPYPNPKYSEYLRVPDILNVRGSTGKPKP